MIYGWHTTPGWLTKQYRDSWTKVIECSKPDRLFEDLRGLFATLGSTIPHDTYHWIRMTAAFGVLTVAWETRARIREPFASFMVASVAMSYLMIFNPRTQSNSYVMTAPFVSLLGSRYLLRGRYAEAIVLFFVGMSWNLGDRWFAPFQVLAQAIELYPVFWHDRSRAVHSHRESLALLFTRLAKVTTYRSQSVPSRVAVAAAVRRVR